MADPLAGHPQTFRQSRTGLEFALVGEPCLDRNVIPMLDIARMILRADLLRAMRALLAWIKVEGNRLDAPEVVEHCRKSDQVVADLLRRETN